MCLSAPAGPPPGALGLPPRHGVPPPAVPRLEVGVSIVYRCNLFFFPHYALITYKVGWYCVGAVNIILSAVAN